MIQPVSLCRASPAVSEAHRPTGCLNTEQRLSAALLPVKAGTTVEGLPVFDSVHEAVKETGANASVFFVPAAFVLDAFMETIDAGIKLIVIVPEHIPVKDVIKMRNYAIEKGVFALGPTTPGISRSREGKNGHYAGIHVCTGSCRDYLPKRYPLI